MGKFILKRLIMLIPVVLGVTIVIFTLMFVVPGDAAELILGTGASRQEIEEKREELGLNDPYIVQLGRYMYNVFIKFDFGKSYYTDKSVTAEMMKRMPNTLILGFTSMVLSLAIGVPLGIIAAVKQNSFGDHVSMVIALIGVSMPSFWLGLLLVALFAVKLHWVEPYGIENWTGFIIPCVASAFSGIAGLARQSRSSMLEVIRADYNATARAKGLSEREIIVKQALPNALLPIITIAGSQFSHIFGGSVVIETVFSIPGVGMYMVSAINQRDYPVIEGCVIILSIIFTLVMLLVDITYALVDPRIKAKFAGKR